MSLLMLALALPLLQGGAPHATSQAAAALPGQTGWVGQGPGLPAGLTLEAALVTNHHADRTGVGDPVEAVLIRDVKDHGAVLLPKGTRLLGRIAGVARGGSPGDQCAFGFVIDRFEGEGVRGRFRGRLTSVGPEAVGAVSRPLFVKSADGAPGEGRVLVIGFPQMLPKGLRLVWVSEGAGDRLDAAMPADTAPAKPAPPQDPAVPVPPELLQRIRERAIQNLERLPNYTCRMTIERFANSQGSSKLRQVDTLRLEVAYVNRREVFSWPGGREFGDEPITELVGGGTIGNGSFGLHLRALFALPGPVFGLLGRQVFEGRDAIRLAYRVPRESSRYLLQGTDFGTVGYHGEVWVDAETLDILRLDVDCDDIPPRIGIAEAHDRLTFARFPIGGSEFLLPRQAELRLFSVPPAAERLKLREANTARPRPESFNRTRFDACREYVGESSVSFEPPPAAGPEPVSPPPGDLLLPAGLLVEARLVRSLKWSDTATGDPVSFELARSLKDRQGTVLLAEGTRLQGRVIWSRRDLEGPQPRWAVQLSMHAFEAGGRSGSLHAELFDVLTGASASLPSGFRVSKLYEPGFERKVLVVGGQRSAFPEGLRLVFRTLASK